MQRFLDLLYGIQYECICWNMGDSDLYVIVSGIQVESKLSGLGTTKGLVRLASLLSTICKRLLCHVSLSDGQ